MSITTRFADAADPADPAEPAVGKKRKLTEPPAGSEALVAGSGAPVAEAVGNPTSSPNCSNPDRCSKRGKVCVACFTYPGTQGTQGTQGTSCVQGASQEIPTLDLEKVGANIEKFFEKYFPKNARTYMQNRVA